MKEMTHRMTKKVGHLREGQLVSSSDPFVRRKIAEGGCTEELDKKAAKGAPANKAVQGAPENKGGTA